VTQKTGSPSDLGWLLDDLVHRLPHTRTAVVLSADGLLMASSEGMSQDDGEHLAAVAAGTRFGGGPVRQTIIEMATAFLLVTVAGKGACLAVLADEDADVGLIAYEMAMLVTAMGHHLTSPSRSESAGEGRPA